MDEGDPWSTSRLRRTLAAGKVVGESKDRKENSPTSDDSNHEDAENLPPTSDDNNDATSDDNNDEDAEKTSVANDDNNAEGAEQNSPTSDGKKNDASDPPPINYVGHENSQTLMDLFGLTVSATAAVLKPLADKAQQVTISSNIPLFHWLYDMRFMMMMTSSYPVRRAMSRWEGHCWAEIFLTSRAPQLRNDPRHLQLH